MANYIYLNDILLPLSNLLGEETIPNPVPTSRANAVQAAVNRFARLYDFDWEMQTFTVTLTNNVGTLDPTIELDANLRVWFPVAGLDNDTNLDEVPYSEFDQYTAGDNKYCIIYTPNSATQIQITEPLATVNVRATLAAPTISSTVGIAIDDPWVVAYFALVFAKKFDDKDADVSVEEATAQQALQELISRENKNNPVKRAVSIMEVKGHRTGEVNAGYYDFPYED